MNVKTERQDRCNLKKKTNVLVKPLNLTLLPKSLLCISTTLTLTMPLAVFSPEIILYIYSPRHLFLYVSVLLFI